MILLVATICMQADPLPLDCRTEVIRVEKTPIACIRMIEPVGVWLTETYSPAWIGVARKGGVFG